MYIHIYDAFVHIIHLNATHKIICANFVSINARSSKYCSNINKNKEKLLLVYLSWECVFEFQTNRNRFIFQTFSASIFMLNNIFSVDEPTSIRPKYNHLLNIRLAWLLIWKYPMTAFFCLFVLSLVIKNKRLLFMNHIFIIQWIFLEYMKKKDSLSKPKM